MPKKNKERLVKCRDCENMVKTTLEENKELQQQLHEYKLAATAEADKVDELTKENKELKEQIDKVANRFSRDICAKNEFYYPKAICQNQPPPEENFYNACLSCPLINTCKQLANLKGKG